MPASTRSPQPKLLGEVRRVLACRQGMGLAVRLPAWNLAADPRANVTRRHHVDPSVISKAY